MKTTHLMHIYSCISASYLWYLLSELCLTAVKYTRVYSANGISFFSIKPSELRTWMNVKAERHSGVCTQIEILFMWHSWLCKWASGVQWVDEYMHVLLVHARSTEGGRVAVGLLQVRQGLFVQLHGISGKPALHLTTSQMKAAARTAQSNTGLTAQINMKIVFFDVRYVC